MKFLAPDIKCLISMLVVSVKRGEEKRLMVPPPNHVKTRKQGKPTIRYQHRG
jgi:hypothetical protein